MKKKLLILAILLTQSHAMDYFRNWWSGETPIKNPQAYAEQCLRTNEYPILSPVEQDLISPIRGATIPKTSLVYEQDTVSEAILATNRGHHIKGQVTAFRMEHSFPALDFAKKHPLAVLGGYAATFILPAMISTPLWTIGIAGGLGYTWWSNREVIASSWNDLQKIRALSGLETSLEQALSRSGRQLEPTFKPDGTIQFQGNIPNGIIPGQSLYVELMVKPIAELSIN